MNYELTQSRDKLTKTANDFRNQILTHMELITKELDKKKREYQMSATPELLYKIDNLKIELRRYSIYLQRI